MSRVSPLPWRGSLVALSKRCRLDDMTREGESLQSVALRVLEWHKLLEIVASSARSSMGADRCRALRGDATLDSARQKLTETTEMVALRAGTDPFPSLSVPDPREPLARAVKGAPMETHELRDCATILELAEDVRRYLGRHRHDAPALNGVAQPLVGSGSFQRLREALDAAIDRDGSIKESATPELRRLTQHVHGLKQTMRHRLEHILQSSRYTEVLQEFYFLQREGRYVVPVKAEMQGRIPGIVHDVSASGATVFLEPRELVELNNAIKVADLEVDREVRRILRELSSLVAEQADVILAALEGLAALDCIMAKAEFSARIRGSPVSLNDHGRIMLKQARHPLLVLAKERVVPNDILFDESVRVLVISGPNTGGKTVTLKILGMFALMVCAGIQVPCEPESEMTVCSAIYADIGDAQDLAKDLSSFSAHMVQMVELLKDAEAAGGDGTVDRATVLVLLDEPVTSTDPAEGAALASALLGRLAQLHMKVVATTHYMELKVLAQTTPGFANASVEFDVSTLSPTYRLFMGTPGGSSAIDIAGRLGMEESVLEEARRRLHQDDRALDRLLNDLQQKQRRVAEEGERLAQARAEAERSARESQALLARLQGSEREERKGIKRKLTEEFMRARAEVQATIDGLKKDKTLLKAKEAKQRLVELETHVRAELAPPVERKPIDRLAVGDQVEIGGLGMVGVLLEDPRDKKRVRVKVGEGEILATVSGLIGMASPPAPAADRVPPSKPGGPRSSTLRPGELDTESVMDVRGKMADEALDLLVSTLDRATLAGMPTVRIIHGHGTGRLKTVLREYLKDSPYVSAFRAGERAEGGDGVTIVELR